MNFFLLSIKTICLGNKSLKSINWYYSFHYWWGLPSNGTSATCHSILFQLHFRGSYFWKSGRDIFPAIWYCSVWFFSASLLASEKAVIAKTYLLLQSLKVMLVMDQRSWEQLQNFTRTSRPRSVKSFDKYLERPRAHIETSQSLYSIG